MTIPQIHFTTDVLALLLISSLSILGVAPGRTWTWFEEDLMIPGLLNANWNLVSGQSWIGTNTTRVFSLLTLVESLLLFCCFFWMTVYVYISYSYSNWHYSYSKHLSTIKKVLGCIFGQPKASWWSRYATLANFFQLDPFILLSFCILLCFLLFGSCRAVWPPHIKHLLSKLCTFLCWFNASCPSLILTQFLQATSESPNLHQMEMYLCLFT